MTRVRQRLLLVVAALVAVVSTAVVVVPDRSEPRSAVGTRDDARAVGDRPDGLLPGEIDILPEDDAEDVDTGTHEQEQEHPVTSTTVRPTSTTVRRAPTTTSTTVAPPRTLAGRIAWVESDAELGQNGRRVWSAAPDGTDARAELAHCSPGGLMGSWLDVSPDGTLVALDCGSSYPAQDQTGTGVTIQEVATGRSWTVLHHGMFEEAVVRWSTDGRSLAISGFRTLHLVDALTHLTRPVLLSQPLDSPVVTWAPDDRTLLSEHGDVIEVLTGIVTRRSDLVDPAPADAASWSHQVRWGVGGALYLQVGWQSGSNEGPAENHYQVFSIDRATGARTRIVDQPTFLGRVDFLPDGRLLVNDGVGRMYTVRADGTGRQDFPFGPQASNGLGIARGSRPHSPGAVPPEPSPST